MLHDMTTTIARGRASGLIRRHLGTIVGSTILAVAMGGPAWAAADPGKKACAKEARVLCPVEMKSMSRKRVEACMIAKVDQTSPGCKAAMYRIKAQREQGGKR